MIYTIDMLLAELGQGLPLGNGERYRVPVTRYVKYVFARIGHKKTADVYIQPFDVNSARIDPLPEYVLNVQDVGWTADKMSGEMFGPGHHSTNKLAFMITPFGMSFPNLDEEPVEVFLMFQSLPIGEDGKVVIMEEAYQACYDYAYAKLIVNFPAHPRYQLQFQLENAALGQIDEARKHLNQKGRLAQNRVLRKYN